MNQLKINQIEKDHELQISYMSLIAIIFFAWLASGCGASTTKTAAQTGAAIFTPTSSTSLASTTDDMVCNGFSTSNIRLDAKLRTNVGSEDTIRVRITGLTNQFDSSSNVTLQMFRWKANADGTPNLDAAPLSFHLQTPGQNGAGGTPMTNSMTQISMADITKLGASTSAESFFNQVDIIVHGVSFDWKAIKFVLYSTNTVLVSNDALIPEFLANPTTYAAGHPAVLSQLHPFLGQSGITDYVSASQSFCF